MSMVLGPCTWGRRGQGPVEGPPPTCGQTDRQTDRTESITFFATLLARDENRTV